MNVTPERLESITDEIMADVIAIRRHLHQHPELSGEEADTAAFIAEKCRQLGCSLHTEIGGHGVLAELPLHTENAAKAIILRADMDALPIQDGKQCDYISQVDGVSHACGHDVHSTILLGALMLLKKLDVELPYHVAAVFQPAEEITEGAAAMIRDGILDQMDSYRAYALHVSPYLPAGSIGLKAGPMCAAADMFEVEITGRGGHAARPHECIDVILIASQIIQALHHIISRKVDPMHPAVLTIGQIEGGHAANVIPDWIRFSGTVRSLDTASHEEIRTRMDHIIRQTAETWGASASFQMHHATPVLENDPHVVKEIRQTLSHYAPDIPLIDIPEPSMGGEDFAEFLQRVPGCLMRLGTGSSPATRYPLHHACFDIDEQAMKAGIIALASLCLTRK